MTRTTLGRGRSAATLALLMALASTGLTVAGPATAHSALKSVTPAANATLTKAPGDLVLVFNEDVNPRFVQVALTTSGTAVTLSAPTVSGPKVSAKVTGAMASGGYTIAYRVVSTDGHPVSGESAFRLTLPVVAPASPTTAPATPASSSTPATSPSSSATPSGTSTPPTPTEPTPTYKTPQKQPTTIGHADHRPGIIVAILLVAGGVALLLFERRRRHGRSHVRR